VIATVVAVRVDGHGTEHLSLHANRQQALARLVEVGRKAWRNRFGYDLSETLDAAYWSDLLAAEGWRVRLGEEVVEL
jgi:hypothetical protein